MDTDVDIEEHQRVILGYNTYYQTAGTGRPLVLIHGIGGSCLNFAENIAGLATQYRVYAVDVPGHGRSDKPDADYEVENAVPFIATFIREVCGEPAALIGMSAGGLMCALTAASHPELVTHLVLVSSAGLGRDLCIPLRLLSLPVTWPVAVAARPTPAGVRLSLRHVVHDPSRVPEEMVVRLCEDRARPGNVRAMLLALKCNVNVFGLKRWRHYLRSLRHVPAPIMIIWGREDRLIPVKHAYQAWRWLGKRARLHVFDRCGHWPPYEHPAEFNRLVVDFVR
jgi:pimeloyl-ACP methyl ester carboxylesterase